MAINMWLCGSVARGVCGYVTILNCVRLAWSVVAYQILALKWSVFSIYDSWKSPAAPDGLETSNRTSEVIIINSANNYSSIIQKTWVCSNRVPSATLFLTKNDCFYMKRVKSCTLSWDDNSVVKDVISCSR